MRRKSLMIKIVAAALAITAVMALSAAVYGTGTASDPLVSLSYLTGAYRTDLLSDVNTAVAAQQKQLSSEFSAQVSALSSSLSTQTPAAVENDFQVVNLTAGQSTSVAVGGEVLFLSGSATVDVAGLTDTTSGSVLAAGGALTANHLYVSSGACVIHASAAAKLLVK